MNYIGFFNTRLSFGTNLHKYIIPTSEVVRPTRLGLSFGCMASELPPLLNPNTPLAWLPPEAASHIEASQYLYAATVGAWLWDFLGGLPGDYRMFTKHKLSPIDAIYVLARLVSGAFIMTALMFQVAPVGKCHALAKAIGWCGTFAVPLNCLLFFFRLKAVLKEARRIVVLFMFMWLATIGCALTAAFGVDGKRIATTRRCVNVIEEYSSALLIGMAVFDTAVFAAICTWLSLYGLADSWTKRLKSSFSGQAMRNMLKTVLQTGQLLYLVTVLVNIAIMVVILIPSVPSVFRALLAIPNIALQNSMACHVYRLLKLGHINDRPSALISSHPSRSPHDNILVHGDGSTSGRAGSNARDIALSTFATLHVPIADPRPIRMHPNV
ncbi:unnamed protein product [Somion occarium]|uniref:Transmembrane protein n=1 Tax=Somion occarium TaxID=3059160 RepID=A0ABP1D6B4_9APHY